MPGAEQSERRRRGAMGHGLPDVPGFRLRPVVTPLSVEISHTGRGVVLALEGELDLAGAATLERELDGLDEGPVVVDLRELAFIDSSGLRALVLAARRLQDAS